MNEKIIREISAFIEGDVCFDDETLKSHSHDASLFEVMPALVVFPKNKGDISRLVKYVDNNKDANPTLSITPRAAGTCMSGGPLNHSIILDLSRYMNKVLEIAGSNGTVEPGCLYRDFEMETMKKGLVMPAFTASKEICAVGGMVANNSGGEKTIKYGKVENYITELEIVFSDGNIYKIKKITEDELRLKSEENTFEGKLYEKIRDLLDKNMKIISNAKPDVSKNSAGYFLWNIWNREEKTFDLCRLIAGSQGTLGIVTEITFRLIEVPKHSNVLAIFLPSLDNLGKIVSEIVPFKPESLESYDDYSMKLAVRFFLDFITYLGPIETLKLGLKFLPESMMILTGGIPKLTIIVEISGGSDEEVKIRLQEIQKTISYFGYKTRIAKSSREADKYWRIRRESFNLLRKHVRGKRTAPFIDDIIVKPEYLPEFLPKVQAALKEYKLVYTVAGHAGDGNFHIIPLMDLTSPYSSDVILDLSKKIYELVRDYKGSITAEHNDGIIRTPYLTQMYGERIINLFKETKEIFDQKNIFNPGKKVGGTFDDIRNALSAKKSSEIPVKALKHGS